MSNEVHKNQDFTMPLRVIFGLVAIATFLSNTPWNQSDQMDAIMFYAGSSMWGLMAVFGNKPGWKRSLTLVVAIIYLALVVGKILGFAT